jgi:hypothetical protein
VLEYLNSYDGLSFETVMSEGEQIIDGAGKCLRRGTILQHSTTNIRHNWLNEGLTMASAESGTVVTDAMLAFDDVSVKLFGSAGTVGHVRTDHGPGIWKGVNDYASEPGVECCCGFCIIHLVEQDLPRKIHWLNDRSKMSSYSRHVKHLARWTPEYHDRSWRVQKQIWINDGEEGWADKFEAMYIKKNNNWRRQVCGLYSHTNTVEGPHNTCMYKDVREAAVREGVASRARHPPHTVLGMLNRHVLP